MNKIDSSDHVYQRNLSDAVNLGNRRRSPPTLQKVPGGCLRPVRDLREEGEDPASVGHRRSIEETVLYQQHIEGGDPHLSTIGVRSQIREGARWEDQDMGWSTTRETPPLPILASDEGKGGAASVTNAVSNAVSKTVSASIDSLASVTKSQWIVAAFVVVVLVAFALFRNPIRDRVTQSVEK